MELTMANGFSGAGFIEMDEQEMMWVDGGDFASFLSGVRSFCKDLVAYSVDAAVGGLVACGIAAVGVAAAPAVAIGFIVGFICYELDLGKTVSNFIIE